MELSYLQMIFSDNTDCDLGSEESNNPDQLNHNQISADSEYFFEDNDKISESEHDGSSGVWKKYSARKIYKTSKKP